MPALLYDGQVMAVQTPDGGSVTTTVEGVSGAVQAGCLALVALAATVWFWRCGRRKRRSIGGWWRVEGPPTEIGDLPVALAAVPPGVCFLSMLYGASWPIAVAGTVVPLLLVALAAWRTWRGEVGRHATASD